MSHFDPRQRATRSELRSFGLLVGGAFLIIAAIIYWRRGATPFAVGFAAIGATLVTLGVVAADALAAVHAGWMRFAIALSKITTPIFMGTVYFLVLTPMALVRRLFGSRPLRASATGTLWVAREPDARRSDLQRQF